MAKCIMIQGTMSNVGKSLLVTALCRIFRQDGYRVAPFKGQNMALNSCITSKGLEMSRAQAVQAEAAGLEPDPRMNPVLLKPSSDTGSQLIVNGRPRGHYQAADYFKLKPGLIPEVLAAYHSLAAEQDIIVIEGAGSPAEINLGKDCFVNMGLAELVNAPVLLVGDIDRGGVFAQLYGTVALLEEEERARIVGTIINKFRGDVSLLRPGLGQLEKLTGVPVLGVVPYLRVDIDDEDSLSPRLERKSHGAPVDIAVIRLPHIANFADLAPLERHPALGVRYVERVTELGDPDLVILPQTADGDGDMAWLRESGLEEAIRERVPVLEIREPGMFDSGVETKKLADRLLARKGLPPVDFCLMARRDYQEEQFDLLARAVRENLNLSTVYRAMEEYERGLSQ
ncbi:cobyric acid synthase [Oscillospiraceae bacterium 50-16]